MLKLIPLLLASIPISAPAQHPLDTLVDKNRVLLVFAPAPSDPRYQQQLTLLQHHQADLKDRDLVIVPILTDPGPPAGAETLHLLTPAISTPDEQLYARTKYHIGPSDFAAILLGKDGGSKLRSRAPLTIEKLNNTIDAMPMRQSEMKLQK